MPPRHRPAAHVVLALSSLALIVANLGAHAVTGAPAPSPSNSPTTSGPTAGVPGGVAELPPGSEHPVSLRAGVVTNAVLPGGGRASVTWDAPGDASAPTTYDVSYRRTIPDGTKPYAGETWHAWFQGKATTAATLVSAEAGASYEVVVVPKDAKGAYGPAVRSLVRFPAAGDEVRWVDVTDAANTSRGGWVDAPNPSYFAQTVLVSERDQAAVTVSVTGLSAMTLIGTRTKNGGRALVQVDGRNWAWLDCGAPDDDHRYQQALRTINLPDTGRHEVAVIASLATGQVAALDAYAPVKG